ncbi:MAG: cohesin domain-containing protein [Microgenomates group bacterium]
MKLKKLLSFLSLLFFFLLAKNQVFAADPHLFLSPASGSYSQKFDVEIKVDTGGQAAGGVDVLLEFPKNLLKIEKVTKGTAFTEVFSSIKNDEGKLRISAYFPFTEAGKSYNGTDGLIATINFNPLGTGTAAVNFVCTPGSTGDSNIVEKITTKDIIVCSANVNGSYTLTGEGVVQPTATPTPGGAVSTPTPTPREGAVSTPTPTPTPPSGATPTPTPPLPVSGSITQTFGLLGLGIFALLTGLALAF